MNYFTKIILAVLFTTAIYCRASAQTLIPNSSFENWNTFPNYSDPVSWDSPNEELSSIPIFGTTVVTKSTDHHGTGSYSVRLESKHITIPPLDAPGFITTGTLTINLSNGTYTIGGGAPITDQPTHLQGYYKYFPKGGDSCLIGIALFKTIGSVQDTVAYGDFSTKDTVSDWTFFSAWISYDTVMNPDTMNVFAFSTASDAVTPGTVLYLDDLFLDYTAGIPVNDPSAGINIYNDRETSRLMIFFGFEKPEPTSVYLYNMMGQNVALIPTEPVGHARKVIAYGDLRPGIYVLEIVHSDKKFCRKYFLKQY